MNCTANFSTNILASHATNSSFLLEICVYSINVLLGLPLHSYITWHIITGSGLASEFFFLNLSVCEIGVCLTSLIFLLDFVPFFQQHLKYFLVFAVFLQGLCTTGAPLFECLMCVERYLAVIHPVTFLKFKPLRYRLMCSAVIWLLVLGSCVFSTILLKLFNVCEYILFFLLQFFLFLSIQLFCCVAVLRALKQSGPGERGREREEINHMKRRAFYLILLTTVSMLVIYVPIIISSIFSFLSQENMRTLWNFSFSCFVFGSFMQPVLYMKRTGRFFCVFSL